MPNAQPPSRVLLKVSGEALMGDAGFGIDGATVDRIARDIKEGFDLGVTIGVVVGGGNIFRGVRVAAKGGDRVTGDHMGMLATVINALSLRNALQKLGVQSVVMSAIAMPEIAESFSQRKALTHLAQRRVVIFAGGTGNPFFTTDTAAALRAAEMSAKLIMKATQVDGIYTADPKLDPRARRFDRISHDDILARGLTVMDTAAIAVARENAIPIAVFSIHEPGSFAAVLRGEGRATYVADDEQQGAPREGSGGGVSVA